MKSASLFLVYCLIGTGFAKPPVFLSYQDSLGQYSFGYSAPGSARSEIRTSNGATRGTYSYVDETGVIQTAQYVADSENGFRVIATNLPQAPLPVQDTPEVMAARTAHFQALELAIKRDEEARNREENGENARERKIEGNQGDASLYKIQGRLEAKIVEIPLNEGEPKALENTKNIVLKDSDEILQAVASKSGIDKASEKSAREEFAGRVSQEIIGGANIPAIPLISSHVPLSQPLGQHAVPVFRISYGNYEIEPSAISESSIAEGAFGVITPAATTLKSATAIPTEGAATPKKKESSQSTTEQIRAVNPLSIAPLSVIPLGSSQPGIIRYVPSTPLHYVAYNVL